MMSRSMNVPSRDYTGACWRTWFVTTVCVLASLGLNTAEAQMTPQPTAGFTNPDPPSPISEPPPGQTKTVTFRVQLDLSPAFHQLTSGAVVVKDEPGLAAGARFVGGTVKVN